MRARARFNGTLGEGIVAAQHGWRSSSAAAFGQIRSLSRRETEVGFAADSLLEGDGFKLSVPRVLEPSDLICHLIRLLGGRPIRAPAVAFASRVLCRTTSGRSWLSSYRPRPSAGEEYRSADQGMSDHRRDFTDSYPDYKFFATQLRTARRRFDEVAGQAVASACSVAGGVAWSLPSRSWIRPARIWRCTAIPIWFGRSLGHAR